MTALFDAGFLWSGLGWLCFMIFTLLAIVLLFPQFGSSKPELQEPQEDLLKISPEEPSTTHHPPRKTKL